MLKHNQHVITQQIVELHVPSAAGVHKTLQAVAQRLRAMTDVEALFDRFAKPEHTIKLDRVEINLGDLSICEWQEQLESRLVAQLTEVLKQATAHDSEKSTASEPGQDDLEQLLYFLRNGQLPTWAEPPSDNWPHQWVQELDSTQWQSLRAELTQNEHVRHRLIHTLDDKTLVTAVEKLFGLREVLQIFNLWFRARLPQVQQALWRTQFWLALLDPVTTNDEHERGLVFMRRLLQLQANLDIPSASTREGPSIVSVLPEPWRDWFDKVKHNIENSTSITSQEERNAIPTADNTTSKPLSADGVPQTPTERSIPLDPSLTKEKPSSTSNGISEPPELYKSITSQEERNAVPTADNNTSKPLSADGVPQTPTERSIPLDPSLTKEKPSSTSNGINEPPESYKSIASPESPQRISSDTPDTRHNDRPMDIDEVIHINGAGCIILHPFLEELFRSINLLEGRDFRDERSQQRAVRLLSRLTFGDEATPEYELLLPKLLCGMAWEEPLPPVELSNEEHLACDELLDAVLGHWQALNGCSANWMREQFFLRRARLEQLNDHWLLTVERHAQDVLLDRLPWGIGVVVLPWRRGMIYVRWTE